MTQAEVFNKFKYDVEKWKWLIENKNVEYTVMLDNDDTFVVFGDDDEMIGQFSDYIGWSDGVCYLLEALGINHECV